MSGAGVRVGVGTRFAYDGEVVEVVEMLATTAGNEVLRAIVKTCGSRSFKRLMTGTGPRGVRRACH